MVRALINGERKGTPLQVLILVAMLLLSIGGLMLTLQYKSAAHHAQTGEYLLCLQRETYDQRAHELEQADVDLQDANIATLQHVTSSQLRDQLISAAAKKLAADQAYLRTPVVDGCELLKP